MCAATDEHDRLIAQTRRRRRGTGIVCQVDLRVAPQSEATLALAEINFVAVVQRKVAKAAHLEDAFVVVVSSLVRHEGSCLPATSKSI